MSLLGAAFNIGFIVGPALGGLLAHPESGHAGFRIPLLVCAGLSAVCVTGLALFLKESRVQVDRFSHQASRWAVVGQAVRHPVIARLMLVTFLAGCAFTGIESIFGLWTQARFGWGPRQVGTAFAVVGIVAAFSQLLNLPNEVADEHPVWRELADLIYRNANEPTGWLHWALQMRHALMHRPRLMAASCCPASSRSHGSGSQSSRCGRF